MSLKHYWKASLGEGNGNPLQYSSLKNPRDGGAWWAAVYGVTQSQTRLKRLSSSSRFPWGSVVKNPPANGGDTGSISDPGRSHMPWSNYACAPQLLSLCSRAWKPPLLRPCATTIEEHPHTPEPVLRNKRN